MGFCQGVDAQLCRGATVLLQLPQSIDEIAQQAHSGADISEHFTGRFQAKQQVNLALPLELLRNIDAECQL
jgi:hypothetical protein